jgi:hypothetical protein
MESLGTDLVASGMIPDASMLKDFARGFSMANKHFTIVDAGNTRDSVDEKVRGEHFIPPPIVQYPVTLRY